MVEQIQSGCLGECWEIHLRFGRGGKHRCPVMSTSRQNSERERLCRAEKTWKEKSYRWAREPR